MIENEAYQRFLEKWHPITKRESDMLDEYEELIRGAEDD